MSLWCTAAFQAHIIQYCAQQPPKTSHAITTQGFLLNNQEFLSQTAAAELESPCSVPPALHKTLGTAGRALRGSAVPCFANSCRNCTKRQQPKGEVHPGAIQANCKNDNKLIWRVWEGNCFDNRKKIPTIFTAFRF